MTREEEIRMLRAAVAAAELEKNAVLQREADDAERYNAAQDSSCRFLQERNTAVTRAEQAEADARVLRKVLGEVLAASLLTYHLERDNPALIARANELVAGPMKAREET